MISEYNLLTLELRSIQASLSAALLCRITEMAARRVSPACRGRIALVVLHKDLLCFGRPSHGWFGWKESNRQTFKMFLHLHILGKSYLTDQTDGFFYKKREK